MRFRPPMFWKVTARVTKLGVSKGGLRAGLLTRTPPQRRCCCCTWIPVLLFAFQRSVLQPEGEALKRLLSYLLAGEHLFSKHRRDNCSPVEPR